MRGGCGPCSVTCVGGGRRRAGEGRRAGAAPGETAPTDSTSAAEFGVTIAGQLFVHLLCVFELPYSNCQWATVCLSESLAGA